MKITLSDIPDGVRTKEYVVETYNVSKVSAWRLLSGRVDHICPGYHVESVNIASGAWDAIIPYTRHMRNCIAYQIESKWGKRPSAYIEDLIQECYIRAYKKSGIWIDMPEQKKLAYLATLAKRTTNDYLKKHVHYTDTCKNNSIHSKGE